MQECFQKGSPARFRGGFKALESLCENLNVPVILKEVGSGFSYSTLDRLQEVGLAAVDMAGAGGTHWGLVEGGRLEKEDQPASSAKVFTDWGFSTVESLLFAKQLRPSYCLWASGGVRNGLDAAKLLALGAEVVGLAYPFLEPLNSSHPFQFVTKLMATLENELRLALFLTGCKDLKTFRQKQVWELVK